MSTGRFPLERRGPEVLVHLAEAVEHRRKFSEPTASMAREADRRAHRVAPADPVPDPNMLAVSMPNFATSLAFVETATKCLATDRSSLPDPRRTRRAQSGVRHRLQSREGLGRHDERVSADRDHGPLPRARCHRRWK